MVLYQNKSEVLRVDLTEPQNVADLLNLFFDYTEPEKDFAKAGGQGLTVEDVPSIISDAEEHEKAWRTD